MVMADSKTETTGKQIVLDGGVEVESGTADLDCWGVTGWRKTDKSAGSGDQREGRWTYHVV